jgi:hypothetical protein
MVAKVVKVVMIFKFKVVNLISASFSAKCYYAN